MGKTAYSTIISSSEGVVRAVALALVMLWALAVPAQEHAVYGPTADTLSIRFRLDSIRIDMGFADNAACWQQFEHHFLERYQGVNPAALRLDIYSGASPEGTPSHNRWLGENRGLAIRRLVRQRLGNRVGSIVVHNEAARWDGFYDLVAASSEPWRDEVLRIIEMPATAEDNELDHREYKLRRLHGGRVWPVLLDKYLSPLRSGATAILSWQLPPGAGGGGRRDTIVVRDTVVMMGGAFGPGYAPGMPGTAALAEADEEAAKRDSILLDRLKYPAWAVKTNLLLWGVVAPNIQVEVPLGRRNRWSLELEYFSPWFIWNNNAHASQFQNLGIELRLWLGNRTFHPWLHGWHIGLAAAAGYYDWEWKKSEGYQGEHLNTYFNIGYQHRWGRHWGLDMGMGFGVMATKYRHYYGGSVYPENHLEPWDEHLIWHDTGRYIWPGLCHANISIVYLFNAWPFHTKSRKLKQYREEEE